MQGKKGLKGGNKAKASAPCAGGRSVYTKQKERALASAASSKENVCSSSCEMGCSSLLKTSMPESTSSPEAGMMLLRVRRPVPSIMRLFCQPSSLRGAGVLSQPAPEVVFGRSKQR